MTYGTHSQDPFPSRLLAIEWTMQKGHLQPRWAITEQPRPYRPGWLKWAGNLKGVATPTAVYSAAKDRVRCFYFEFLGKLCWPIKLFSKAITIRQRFGQLLQKKSTL